eukprot:TRINITY_DN7428_c0_g2_i1.p1 TRINITY_DN7428_c0_g2~~TRINITY_DN7428_c0_g2_i1.p1  ORF type:complete len:377 (-),score=106.06 TRINITY_DN7428_c0_g2_i1:998-2128(-)
MRIIGLTILGALSFATQTVNAFTNGTLLPSYLCNNADGYPKSAGTLLPFLQLGINPDNYNQFPPGNATTPVITILASANNSTAVAPTSRQIVGAFHNGGAQQTAAGVAVTPVNYEKASVQPVWLAPATADPVTGQNAGGYVIKPGTLHSFVVAAHCPAPDSRGFNNANVALDGFFAYAVDTGTGKRVGSWVNVGPTFSPWYACNPQGNASASVGIVHNQLITNNPNVANLTWMAPANITGLIKFVGAGVSDCAFGPFNVTFNVSTTTTLTAPSPTVQGLNPNAQAANTAPFFAKGVAADLPQTIGNPVPAGAAAATTTTTTTTTTAAMNTPATGYTPGAVAGIAIAGAVIGGIVVGAAMFFIGRRAGTSNKAPLLL